MAAARTRVLLLFGGRSAEHDVSRVTARHLDPARLVTVVVGDLDAIGPDLGALSRGEPAVLPPDRI